MKLSVVIPARNEGPNIGECLDRLVETLESARGIPFELLVVDDGSSDDTAAIVAARARSVKSIRLLRRESPPGLGRAVRSGLDAVSGDVVVVFMADLSDSPEDVLAYYRKIQEGHDCVFGSRFLPGSSVTKYPRVKLVLNRAANRAMQVLFRTRLNDLTNAFKAYRVHVLRECAPFTAEHFDITLELSLKALLGGYTVAQIPIRWSGRKAGVSNLRMQRMLVVYLKMLGRMVARAYRLDRGQRLRSGLPPPGQSARVSPAEKLSA
jgi:dolichol-phosphate mannosyltransferase